MEEIKSPVYHMSQMGYANLDQTAGGIHTRLFSRAFIVDDGSRRVVFVSADIGMVSQRLRLEVPRQVWPITLDCNGCCLL